MPGVRRQTRRYSWSSSISCVAASVSSACRICTAVVLASVISSGPASLRQHVRSTAPTVLPEIGCWIGTPGAGEVLEVLGVVLVAEHVHRLAALEGRADPVGADELLGIAEARNEQDAVEVARQVGVAGQPGQHEPGVVGEHDADRLPGELLVQPAQHGLGAAGQRSVQVRVAHVRHLDAVGGDVAPLGPQPRREDGLAHLARLDRLGGEEAHPGLGEPGAVGQGRCPGWCGPHGIACLSGAAFGFYPAHEGRSGPRRRANITPGRAETVSN